MAINIRSTCLPVSYNDNLEYFRVVSPLEDKCGGLCEFPRGESGERVASGADGEGCRMIVTSIARNDGKHPKEEEKKHGKSTEEQRGENKKESERETGRRHSHGPRKIATRD